MAKKVIYQKLEQEKNRKKAFKIISLEKTVTVKSLAQALGVSVPTSTNIINGFIEEKILTLSEEEEKTQGRKASKYLYNSKSIYSIGISIEVDYLKLILIDLDGNIIKKAFYKESFADNSNLIDFIIWELEIFLSDFEEVDKIIGIGISVPGIVKEDEQVLEIGVNLNLYNKDMSKIEEYFGKKVFIENEANSGAVFEYIKTEGIADEGLVFLSISTDGIGAGILLEGKPYYGRSRKAGEVGHFTVEVDGRLCNCGNRGCLEKYVSNRAIVEEFKKEYPNLRAYNEIFIKKYFDTEIGKEIKSKYIKYLGAGIRNLLMFVDPNKIIIGGLIGRYASMFEEELKKEVFNNSFYKNEKRLEFSKYFDEATLLGAAFIPLKEYYF